MERGIGALLIVGAIVLIALGLVARGQFQRLHDTADRADQTNRTLTALEAVHVALLDAETGQRGYLLTSQRSYLAPYFTGVASARAGMDVVASAAAGSAGQDLRVARLRELANLKLAELAQTIDLHERGQQAEALAIVQRNKGKELMDGIRAVSAELTAVEQAQLALRKTDARAAETSTERTFWATATGLGLIFAGAYWLIRRELRTRQAARNERQLAAERVELALRGADLGLWDLHVPTDTLVINAREREILGFAPDDELPQGPQWRDRIHPDDRAAVDAAVIPHLRGKDPSYECEHRMQHADGNWIWVFTRAMIVERDDKGGAARIVGTHLDVTERKATERRLASISELLQDSEAQLRQIADNLPALVSRFDDRQRLRFVNRAYQEWLHVEPEWLLGRTLREIYGDESYSQFQHHIEAALGGRKVVYQRKMPTPDGLRHVEVTLVPDVDDHQAVRGAYALIQDITTRHKAEADRARSENRLSLALEGSSQALFDWDIVAGTTYQSAQAAAMRGEPAIEATLTMEALRSHVHPDDAGDVLGRMEEAVRGATANYSAEYRLRHSSGAWFWVRARGRVVERDAAGRALRLAGTYADITERKIAEGRLRRLAEHDSLTELPNRALFHDRLQQALIRSARGKPMALLFLDIDHFKRINDTFGHETGDEVLKVFAARMRRTVRRSDTVARLAGDEFTIILEDLAAPDDASRLTQELVQALREPISLGGQWVQVTASVGIALYVRGANLDEADLLRKADAALYEAKRRGRNAYFVDEMTLADHTPATE